MKLLYTACLMALLSISSPLLHAQAQVGIGVIDDPHNRNINENTKDLVKYLKNLGLNLGYDLTKTPLTPLDGVRNDILLNASVTQKHQNYVYNAVLGATPVNALSDALKLFLPTNSPLQLINAFANFTFSSLPYSSPKNQDGKIGVSSLIDQKPYQPDPINQNLFNILGTPDDSYCYDDENKTNFNLNCQLLDRYKVMNNVIGTLPEPQDFFKFPHIKNFLAQLNGNTLIAPLMYSDEQTGTSTGTAQGENKGLTAQSQAQTAANFIRYASGMVIPTELPSKKEYGELYIQATDKNSSANDRKQAQNTLSNYFNRLRIYSAQMSVGLSNFYAMLSKRIPQNFSRDGGSDTVTSQALSEFNMATWRLFDPANANATAGQPSSQQWIDKINTASPATVQKEIAVLLAEINYQMYLNRQQQERLLLTNTIMMMQNLKNSEPIPQFYSKVR